MLSRTIISRPGLSQVWRRCYAHPAAFPSTPFPSESDLVPGFRVGAVAAGIKKQAKDGTRPLDLAIIHSEKPTRAAGLFTTNLLQAAPIQHTRSLIDSLHGEGIEGVVINAGCANACTGSKGIEDAKTMSSLAYKAMGGKGDSAAAPFGVMSTGVIGDFLPIKKIADGISAIGEGELKGDLASWDAVSRAIMTTDTVPKFEYLESNIPRGDSGDAVHFAGVIKGAGMIHPNMATMLSVIATDAPVAAGPLRAAMRYVGDRTYNCMSIDGDTSTNDCVVILANGDIESAAAIKSEQDPGYIPFRNGLMRISEQLTRRLVADGEGITKLIYIRVRGENMSFQDLRTIGHSISTSALVKTAFYGQDANWGRIMAAAGYAGVNFNPDEATLQVASVERHGAERKEVMRETLFENGGRSLTLSEEKSSSIFRGDEIFVDLCIGKNTPSFEQPLSEEQAKKIGEATVTTCDFSHEYVTINGSYRS